MDKKIERGFIVEELKNKAKTNEEIEIDLSRLFAEIRKKLRFIFLLAILGALIAFIFTTFFIDKKYASSSDIYPKTNTTDTGTLDYNALNANSKMINNYIAIIKGDSVLDEVTKSLNLEGKGSSYVKNAISVTNEPNTEIIKITATTEDPELSRDIVAETVNQFITYVKDKIDVKNIMVLNQAKINETPVSPSIIKNIGLGTLIGIVISGGIVILRFLLDKRLHTKDDAETYLEIPVLAEIPYYED